MAIEENITYYYTLEEIVEKDCPWFGCKCKGFDCMAIRRDYRGGDPGWKCRITGKAGISNPPFHYPPDNCDGKYDFRSLYYCKRIFE